MEITKYKEETHRADPNIVFIRKFTDVFIFAKSLELYEMNKKRKPILTKEEVCYGVQITAIYSFSFVSSLSLAYIVIRPAFTWLGCKTIGKLLAPDAQLQIYPRSFLRMLNIL